MIQLIGEFVTSVDWSLSKPNLQLFSSVWEKYHPWSSTAAWFHFYWRHDSTLSCNMVLQSINYSSFPHLYLDASYCLFQTSFLNWTTWFQQVIKWFKKKKNNNNNNKGFKSFSFCIADLLFSHPSINDTILIKWNSQWSFMNQTCSVCKQIPQVSYSKHTIFCRICHDLSRQSKQTAIQQRLRYWKNVGLVFVISFTGPCFK
jgi:hypothetical protein